VELAEAVRNGQAKAEAVEAGGEMLGAWLHISAKEHLTINVAAGTYFAATNGNGRRLVVTAPCTFKVTPGSSQQFSLPAAFADMRFGSLGQPETLALRPMPGGGQEASRWTALKKMLTSQGFQALDEYQKQFAVWTITEDPASREKYLRIKLQSLSQPSQSSVHEPNLAEIRAALQQAGIEPSRLLVFRDSHEAGREAESQALWQNRVNEALISLNEMEKAAFEKAEASGRSRAEALKLAGSSVQPLRQASESWQAAARRVVQATEARKKAVAEAHAAAKAEGLFESAAAEQADRATQSQAEAESEAHAEAETAWKEWIKLLNPAVPSPRTPTPEASR
jgi:hypothetical protein